MFLEHLSCFRKLARALRKEGMGETCFRSDYMVFLTQGWNVHSYWIYWIGLDLSCLLFVFNCHVVHLSALHFLTSFSVTLKMFASLNDYNCRQYHIHFLFIDNLIPRKLLLHVLAFASLLTHLSTPYHTSSPSFVIPPSFPATLVAVIIIYTEYFAFLYDILNLCFKKSSIAL